MIADFTRRHLTLVSLVALLAAAAAVRMPFWLSSTYAYGHGDAILWEVWSRAIYDHGFINVFRTADSNFVATLRGVIQMDNRTYFKDGGVKGNDGFLLRRARPIFEGTLYHDFDFLFGKDPALF